MKEQYYIDAAELALLRNDLPLRIHDDWLVELLKKVSEDQKQESANAIIAIEEKDLTKGKAIGAVMDS